MNEVYIDMRKENEWIRKYFNADFVSIDQLIGCIEDLDGEVEHLKEEYKSLEQDLKDNYRPIPISEQVGIYNSDFI